MNKKTKLLLIGLIQALGVTVYCSLISLIVWLSQGITPPQFIGVIFVLSLLVFSAAVTGSIVFAYSAYLVLNKRVKEGLTLFGYTLAFSLIIILIIAIILFMFI